MRIYIQTGPLIRRAPLSAQCVRAFSAMQDRRAICGFPPPVMKIGSGSPVTNKYLRKPSVLGNLYGRRREDRVMFCSIVKFEHGSLGWGEAPLVIIGWC